MVASHFHQILAMVTIAVDVSLVDSMHTLKSHNADLRHFAAVERVVLTVDGNEDDVLYGCVRLLLSSSNVDVVAVDRDLEVNDTEAMLEDIDVADVLEAQPKPVVRVVWIVGYGERCDVKR